MIAVGVESSCDETAVGVVRDGTVMLSNVILSQKEHSRFGGVVPEIAGRAHVRAISPIFFEAIEAAKIKVEEIDLVAATRGPGLVGCLLVGLSFAKGLALSLGKPFVAINHLEGHIAANFLTTPNLPHHHLTLIISGGHTLLVEALSFGEYRILGATRDDAVGEAFDKVAKLIGLGYPGGQLVDTLARTGNPQAISFPRPMVDDTSYDFSYSGLKTAVANYWRGLSEEDKATRQADVAASFQEAAVDILVAKTLRAARHKKITTVTLSGGVAANSRLRELLDAKLREQGIQFFYPSVKLCMDNGAMIAAAGYYRWSARGESEMSVDASPYLPLV